MFLLWMLTFMELLSIIGFCLLFNVLIISFVCGLAKYSVNKSNGGS